MNLNDILRQAIEEQASDVFIVAGRPVSFRKNNIIYCMCDERLLPDDTEALLKEIYECAGQRDIRLLDSQRSRGCPDFASALINSAGHCRR